jgi:hypothetical protein
MKPYKLKTSMIFSKWCASLTIGNQTFHFSECDTRTEARWFVKMMRHALNKMISEVKK